MPTNLINMYYYFCSILIYFYKLQQKSKTVSNVLIVVTIHKTCSIINKPYGQLKYHSLYHLNVLNINALLLILYLKAFNCRRSQKKIETHVKGIVNKWFERSFMQTIFKKKLALIILAVSIYFQDNKYRNILTYTFFFFELQIFW